MRVLLAFVLALLAPQDKKKEGFRKLFNDKDFTGWSFVFASPNADANKAFQVKDGTIVCTGNPVGYMVTDKKYKEFTLRFDWKFKRPQDLEDDAKFLGNSGYLLFVQEDRVWPKSIEIQGMNRDVARIIFIGGSKGKVTTDAEARKKARKKVGEWNSMEIVVRGGKITASINGTLISTVTDYQPTEGPIGFQSEGAEIHWRKLRIQKHESKQTEKN